MTLTLDWINGNKTYISIILYLIYLVLVKHNYLMSNPDIELFLQGAIGASFVHKVSKIGPDVKNSESPSVPVPSSPKE